MSLIILIIPLVLAMTSLNITKVLNVDTEQLCIIMPGIECSNFLVDHISEYDNLISLNLIDIMGDDITNVFVAIKDLNNEDIVCELSCVNGCTGINSNTMPDNQVTTWESHDCDNIGMPGNTFTGKINFNWVGNGGLPHLRIGNSIAIVH